MKLEHLTEDELRTQLLSIFKRYLDIHLYRVFFYGSRVKNTHDERSDIDVGIWGKEAVPLELMFDLQEAMEALPTLYKVDIVDFHRLPLGMREAIFKEGVEDLTDE